MPEVQADFDLSLDILTPEGALIKAGVYSKKQVLPMYKAQNIRVPHLHQKDPSGKSTEGLKEGCQSFFDYMIFIFL